MEIEAISAVKNSYRQQIAQQDFQQRAEDKRVQSEQPLTISKLSNNDDFSKRDTEDSSKDSFASDEKEKREQRLNFITQKLHMGGKLTQDEKELLEKYDPAKYQKISEEEQEIRSYEIDLSRAKTPEDIARIKFHHAAVAFKISSSTGQSVNVPENIKKIEEAESLSKFIESQLLNGDVDDVEALHRVELAGSTRAAFEAQAYGKMLRSERVIEAFHL